MKGKIVAEDESQLQPLKKKTGGSNDHILLIDDSSVKAKLLHDQLLKENF